MSCFICKLLSRQKTGTLKTYKLYFMEDEKIKDTDFFNLLQWLELNTHDF